MRDSTVRLCAGLLNGGIDINKGRLRRKSIKGSFYYVVDDESDWYAWIVLRGLKDDVIWHEATHAVQFLWRGDLSSPAPLEQTTGLKLVCKEGLDHWEKVKHLYPTDDITARLEIEANSVQRSDLLQNSLLNSGLLNLEAPSFRSLAGTDPTIVMEILRLYYGANNFCYELYKCSQTEGVDVDYIYNEGALAFVQPDETIVKVWLDGGIRYSLTTIDELY